MSWREGDLSREQVKVLEQFKVDFKDVQGIPDDSNHFYLRWLRAAKRNVKRSWGRKSAGM